VFLQILMVVGRRLQ